MKLQWSFIGTSNVNDIKTKAKRFDLVRLRSERKQNVLVWSEFFLYQKQFVSVLAHRFWDEANQFDLVQTLAEAKRNVPM